MAATDLICLAPDDVPWVDASTIEPNLPPSVRAKVLSRGPEPERLDWVVKFPAGFVQPAHTHDKFTHTTLILSGVMKIGDKLLTAGGYMSGGSQLHGPLEYPEGCTLFTSRRPT